MLCNRELYRLFHSGTIAPREFDIDARYRCVCTCVYVSKIDVVFIHRPALYRRGRAFMSGAMIDRCNANSAHHRAFITSPPPFPLCPFYEIVTSYLREIPLRATLTSRLTISLFIIRGDLEIDEQSLNSYARSLRNFFFILIPTYPLSILKNPFFVY